MPNKQKRIGPETRADALWGSLACPVPAGLFKTPPGRKKSERIQDLVGPDPLEPVQRLVQRRELLVRDAADLFHGLDVLLIERIDDAADFLALPVDAGGD